MDEPDAHMGGSQVSSETQDDADAATGSKEQHVNPSSQCHAGPVSFVQSKFGKTSIMVDKHNYR